MNRAKTVEVMCQHDRPLGMKVICFDCHKDYLKDLQDRMIALNEKNERLEKAGEDLCECLKWVSGVYAIKEKHPLPNCDGPLERWRKAMKGE